jgi:ferredoxin-NADP reductase
MEASTSTVRFLGSDRLCSGTAAFSFTRPEGSTFVAGQTMAITLDTAAGRQVHTFSHCDAPADAESMLLTRLTGSPYKNALLALKPGDEVGMLGPMGRLTIGPEVRKAAFLVGGVGVSPARSILRDSVARDTGVEFIVFDGNLDETCVPFQDEFAGYERTHQRIRFVQVLEKPGADWTGERGFIDAGVVNRHCDPLDDWHWYVVGPPAMVTVMEALLRELNVPAALATSENFAGYR